jgi:predicted Zn-dependent protease
MVVAWAPPATSGGLLVDGVGGVGGTSRTSSRLLSGYVLMNSDYSDKAEAGFGAGQPLGLVLMHELGHVVGLDHATDAKQIMAPGSPLPAAVWGAADLNGLRHVGSRCR